MFGAFALLVDCLGIGFIVFWGLDGKFFGDMVGVFRFPFLEGLVESGRIGFHTVKKCKSAV